MTPDAKKRIATRLAASKSKSNVEYATALKAAVSEELAQSPRKKQGTAIVLLGRFGDIINILPVAKKLHDSGTHCHFVVAKEFASVLDGVSYVTPLVLDLDYSEIAEAIKIADEQFDRLIVAQVWGKDYSVEKLCISYNEESWRLAGFIDQFKELPLVFDRRDSERELALIQRLILTPRPIMLLCLGSGVSSRFDHWKIVQKEIVERWSTSFEVIDVSNVRAERIYDLLGLMNQASILITSDTAPLHLAAASDVKVISIYNDAPWLGTKPRCNTVARIPYNQAVASLDQIHGILKSVVKGSSRLRIYSQPTARILHTVERHSTTDLSEFLRQKRAAASWDPLYASGAMIPVHVWDYPRNARQELGDDRELPYLKDVIEYGLREADSEGDVILLTNDDTILHPKFPDVLRQQVLAREVCTGHRCDIRKMPDGMVTPGEWVAKSEPHIGRDIVAFTVRWYRQYSGQIPDFVLGAPEWDLWIARFVRALKCSKTSVDSLGDVDLNCEIPKGYVIHQWHAPKWSRPENHDSAPANVWNRSLNK